MSFIYLLFYREELFVFAHALCFLYVRRKSSNGVFPFGVLRLKVYGVVLVLSLP